jgi:hypothetical protein
MSRLGFKQSPKPQPKIKHLPKTKPKEKIAHLTQKYFLKLIIKICLCHTHQAIYLMVVCWRLKVGGNLVNCHFLHLRLHIQTDDKDPTYLFCQFDKTNAQNLNTQLNKPVITKKKLNTVKVKLIIHKNSKLFACYKTTTNELCEYRQFNHLNYYNLQWYQNTFQRE